MSVWLHICMFTVCMQMAENVTGCPKIGVADGSKLPCGCWILNLGLVQEKQVFLTAEPSLQLQFPFFSQSLIKNHGIYYRIFMHLYHQFTSQSIAYSFAPVDTCYGLCSAFTVLNLNIFQFIYFVVIILSYHIQEIIAKSTVKIFTYFLFLEFNSFGLMFKNRFGLMFKNLFEWTTFLQIRPQRHW